MPNLEEALRSGDPQRLLNQMRLNGVDEFDRKLIASTKSGTNIPVEVRNKVLARYDSWQQEVQSTKGEAAHQFARNLQQSVINRGTDLTKAYPHQAVVDTVRSVSGMPTEARQSELDNAPIQGGGLVPQAGAGVLEFLQNYGNTLISAAEAPISPHSFSEIASARQQQAPAVAVEPDGMGGRIGRGAGNTIAGTLATAGIGGPAGNLAKATLGKIGIEGGKRLAQAAGGGAIGLAQGAANRQANIEGLVASGMDRESATSVANKQLGMEAAVTAVFGAVAPGSDIDTLFGRAMSKGAKLPPAAKQSVAKMAATSSAKAVLAEMPEETIQFIGGGALEIAEREGVSFGEGVQEVLSSPDLGQNLLEVFGTVGLVAGGGGALHGAGRASENNTRLAAKDANRAAVQQAVTEAVQEVQAGGVTQQQAVDKLGQGVENFAERQTAVEQLKAIPRPEGVMNEVWDTYVEDTAEFLQGMPEASEATITPTDNGVMLDFGEGGRVPVLMVSPEEASAVGKKNVDAAYASYRAEAIKRGVKPVTKAMFERQRAAGTAGYNDAFVVLDPEGDAVPIGTNAIMYLNTTNFTPDGLTEEMVHKAVAMHIDEVDVDVVREYLNSKGAAFDGSATDLRLDEDFQEQVVRDLYKPYVNGEFDATPEVKGVVQRIFQKFTDLIDAIMRRGDAKKALAEQSARARKQVIDVLAKIRSGKALGQKPVTSFSKGPAGPLQDRATKKTKADQAAKRLAQSDARLAQSDKAIAQKTVKQELADVDAEQKKQKQADAAEIQAKKKADAEKALETKAKEREDRQAAADLKREQQLEKVRDDKAAAELKREQSLEKARDSKAEADLKQEVRLEKTRDSKAEADLKQEERLNDLANKRDKKLLDTAEKDAKKVLEKAKTKAKGKVDAETTQAAEAAVMKIGVYRRMLTDPDMTKEEKAAVRKRIVVLRTDIANLRANAATRKALIKNVMFSTAGNFEGVTSLQGQDAISQFVVDRMKKKDREAYTEAARLEMEARERLDIANEVYGGRGRSVLVDRIQKISDARRIKGELLADEDALLRVISRELDQAHGSMLARGRNLAKQTKSLLDKTNELILRAGSEEGRGLQRRKEYKKGLESDNPIKQINAFVEESKALTRAQEKQLKRIKNEDKKQAKRAELEAENAAKFISVLSDMGVDVADAMRPENWGNTLFSTQLNNALQFHQAKQLTKTEKAALAWTVASRLMLFGLGAPFRIGAATLFNGGVLDVATHNMLGLIPGVGPRFKDVVKGDLEMFKGLTEGLYGAVENMWTGDSYLIKKVRGEGSADADNIMLGHVSDTKMLIPGDSLRAKVVRMILDGPVRAIGAAEQLTSVPVSRLADASLYSEAARRKGLKGKAADAFIKQQQNRATRDDEVQEASEAEKLDLAAARPFSGKGGSGIAASIERAINNKNPIIRALYKEFIPVFRGPIRGAEQLARTGSPLTAALILLRDIHMASQPDATLAQKRRALAQATKTAISVMIPVIMAAAFSEEDLEELGNASIAGTSFRNIPLIGQWFELQGALAKALKRGKVNEVESALASSAFAIVREVLPLRRVISDAVDFRNKEDVTLENITKSTVMGGRAQVFIDAIDKYGSGEQSGEDTLRSVLSLVSSFKDVLMLMDDEFVKSLDWPDDRKVPNKIPRGEAGFKAMIGLRKDLGDVYGFTAPTKKGEAVLKTVEGNSAFVKEANAHFKRLLRGREVSELPKSRVATYRRLAKIKGLAAGRRADRSSQ